MGLFTHRKTVMTERYFYIRPSLDKDRLYRLLEDPQIEWASNYYHPYLKVGIQSKNDYCDKGYYIISTRNINRKRFYTLKSSDLDEMYILPMQLRISYLMQLHDEFFTERE